MDSLTTLKDRATQLLIKYKSGALVTQLQSSKNTFDFQAPECLSGVLQRRFPLKTTNDSIPLLQVDRFVTVAQKS